MQSIVGYWLVGSLKEAASGCMLFNRVKLKTIETNIETNVIVLIINLIVYDSNWLHLPIGTGNKWLFSLFSIGMILILVIGLTDNPL